MSEKLAKELPGQARSVVPTIVQLELSKWLVRELGEARADQVLAYTLKCLVVPLNTRIALFAADLHRQFKLATTEKELNVRVNTIYDKGRLSFVTPIKLRHERLNVVVEIPEDEIEEGAVITELDDYALRMKAALDAIRLAPLPATDDVAPLTAKQHERLTAFSNMRTP